MSCLSLHGYRALKRPVKADVGDCHCSIAYCIDLISRSQATMLIKANIGDRHCSLALLSH